MSNPPQDSQSELGNILDDLVNMKKPARFHNTDWAEYAIEAYVTTRVKEAIELARSKDPHKCEFGHEVYSHNTVDGWCCACEADQAFMEAEIEARVKEAEELLRAEGNFYKDRCKMERNKYDILAKSTQEKIKEAERLARVDELLALDKSEIANHSMKKMQIRIKGRIEALTTTTNGKEE